MMYSYKMTNSAEPRDRVFIKGYEFLSFPKEMGKK